MSFPGKRRCHSIEMGEKEMELMESTPLRRAAGHGARLIVALILTAFTALPWLAVAQSTPPLEAYHSSEFGYLFWWDPALWTVQEQVAEPGSDWVQLAHGDTVVDVWGYAEPGATAHSCVTTALGEITNDADLVRYEALTSPGTQPGITLVPNGLSAFTQLVLAFDVPEGRETYAVDLECHAIVSGQRVLYTAVWTPAETFNAQNGKFAKEPLFTLTLPRVAYDFVPGEGVLPNDGPWVSGGGRLTPAFTSDGGELALFTLHDYTCSITRERGHYSVILAVENTSFGNMVVTPSNFVAGENQFATAPSFTSWLLPPIDNSQSAVLHDGEVALLELNFDFGDSAPGQPPVYYVDSSGGFVDLGRLGGCGAGTAAPVLIDLE
jgi:hypothetical protein